ncbi:hypothetical protein HY229_04215 [Candidatus Acetothermia bacterium]|nr:hypothetical protein [Candidatus Acetothermia bacterium]MBI3643289.1 hypothetical protein [Candidatus Acetothermia bacterium]
MNAASLDERADRRSFLHKLGQTASVLALGALGVAAASSRATAAQQPASGKDEKCCVDCCPPGCCSDGCCSS